MPERPIDLRSDTVTRPTDVMRRAMAAAELGDDVFGDDPTVIALEERAAELLGKDAGLFVASGTMGNLVAQMAHLARGQETIAGREHHMVLDEAAGHAVVVGTSIRSLQERPDGTLDPQEIAAAFRDPQDAHEPITGLVTLENTHAHSMGQPLTPDYTAAVAAVAHERGVPLHIDGARFWNAAVALGVSGAELAGPADSVTFCLSKGLGCPVGSVVVGGRDFIWRARRARKLVGGGMRQVGILAAAGLLALRDGPAGVTARDLADPADTVTFCLSKGLGCPVGSVLVGSREVIGRARRARKLVGGGMRQVGVLAAAGLVALADGPAGMIDRLADDHANARRLAEALADMVGIGSAGGTAQPHPGPLDPGRVATNFVLFKVDRDRAVFLQALRARNVLMVEYAHGQVRAVTHHDVSAHDIDTVIRATREALAETVPAAASPEQPVVATA